MLTAIVGIFLGNFLVGTLFAPALQELRKILRQFSSIKLPHRSARPGAEQMTYEERHHTEEEAAREFNRLFREYSISFKALKKLGGLFALALITLATIVAWQLPISLTARIRLIPCLIAIILVTGLYLQRAFAPTPRQLVSIDFLQNNFANLHLSSLFDCSRLSIDLGRELFESVAHFRIRQNLMFLGYRFLMAVSDETCSQVFYVSYGQLDGPH